MLDAAYLIPAFPLLGFVAILLVGSRLKEPLAGVIGTLACAGAFVATVVTFFALWAEDEGKRHVTKEVFTWIPSLGVKVAFLLDPLSITMALFVTGVGSLIHLFAVSYMHGDPRYSRFFVYLNLFIVSMLLLVLGDSFLLLFVGWEGVGACSYLLISFWFERPTAATAAKKAFIANRVGDVGLMLAMFLIFSKVGSLTFAPVFKAVEEGAFAKSTVFAIGLLLFLGACGKSAQLPLSIWLPDAMEGPTPVSALIHAATMVTAGVYLLVRVNPFFAVDSRALTVVAWVGVITALWAALVATSQDDIKRVLAYSTISQLGYMFLAVGARAYVAAIFHMVTHAFFKALMFLGSGSVIHGMHEQQDMKRMGGLKKVMPITAYTFLIGWLAIAGVFPLAGFWSKDEILLSALKGFHGPQGIALYAIGLATAVITAYYMTRQIQLVFFGDPRWNEEPKKDKKKGRSKAKAAEPDPQEHHPVHVIEPHESPWPMTVPLMVLAGLAVVGGAVNVPWPGRFAYPLEHWLEPVIEAGAPLHLHVGSLTKVVFSVIATAAAAAGIGAGLAVWRKGVDQPQLEPEVLRKAFYYDIAVSEVVGGPGRGLADAAATTDKQLIDGAVGAVATLVQSTGGELRKLQTGYVRNYALGLTAGAVVLLAYVVFAGRVMQFPYLTAAIAIPFVAGLIVALLPRTRQEAIRFVGLVGSMATATLTVYIAIIFDKHEAGFQLLSNHVWVKSLGISWSLGIDGISLWLVVLTGILFPIGLLGPAVHKDLKAYTAWMLLLEAGCIGSFVARDLFLFFVFFEVVLVPMYFLIAGWGYANRSYAALKFFVYTLAGSAFLLVGILVLVSINANKTGTVTFDLTALTQTDGVADSRLLFSAFMLAFAVKVPIFPFHTWLPDAHTEAPTAGSVILAGVMLKLGTYGILRFAIGLFPVAALHDKNLWITLAVIGMIYGAIVAAMQGDLKRLVAYSSVAHLGFIVLGTFALTSNSLQGAVIQMVNHGISTPALFLLVGWLYERRHTREISQLRGLWKVAPVMGGVFLLVTFASIGLPGLNGFVGEFLVLIGSYKTAFAWTVVGTTAVIFAAVYMLWAFQRVFQGEPDEANASVPDLTWRERGVILPLLVLIVALGVYPKPVLERIEPSTDALIKQIEERTTYRQPVPAVHTEAKP